MPGWRRPAPAFCGSLIMACGLITGCPQPVQQVAAPPTQVQQQTPPPPPGPPPPPPGARPHDRVTPGTVDLTVPPPSVGDVSIAEDALCPGCDVVFISVCSLRRDHLGAYGDTRQLTPTIDALAKESVRFTRAYAGANFTLGSLSTMLTGRFGSSTGVLNWGRGLSDQYHTLPEVLGLYGYATGGFSVDAATGFRPDYGLHKGFQRMVVIDPPRDTPDGRHRDEPMGSGGATAAPMVEWMTEQPTDQPIFAMLHTRSAHFPFVVSDDGVGKDRTGVLGVLWDEGARLREQGAQLDMPGRAGANQRSGLMVLGPLDLQRKVRNAGPPGVTVWKKAYADSVGRMDKDIAAVMAGIDKRGRRDKTIIVLVADHGETLDDNEELLHGSGFFESVVRVPLLVRVPGVKGGTTRDALVSQVDLMPTLLDLVGVVPPERIDGLSMRALITGGAKAIRSTTLVEGGPSWTGDGKLPGAVISPPYALLQQTYHCTPPGKTLGDAKGKPPPPPPSADGGANLDPEAINVCLFDTERDPGERIDIADDHPEVVKQLLDRWSGFRKARAGQVVPRDLRLDPAMVEMLQRTGYDWKPRE